MKLAMERVDWIPREKCLGCYQLINNSNKVMSDFDQAIEWLFRKEGGYSNDPSDYGGETMLGISKRYFPKQFTEIMALPDDQKMSYARDFYEVEFWCKFKCDLHDYPLNIIIFDCAVNTGKSFYVQNDFWYDVLFRRLKHHSQRVKDDPTQLKFLRGWLERVIGLYEEFVKG